MYRKEQIIFNQLLKAADVFIWHMNLGVIHIKMKLYTFVFTSDETERSCVQ